MFPIDDTQFEEYRLVRITDEGTWWVFHLTDSMSIGCEKVEGCRPKPGDTLRLYGKGLGYRNRGMFLNGEKLYYRTAEEDEAKRIQELEEFKAKRRAEFEKNKAQHDMRFDQLPEPFRKRIERFRAEDPDFRWEGEPYEVFCCSEAVKIANTLKTVEAIDAFYHADWDKQKMLVPDLDEGHSGNTFGGACALAKWLLNQV